MREVQSLWAALSQLEPESNQKKNYDILFLKWKKKCFTSLSLWISYHHTKTKYSQPHYSIWHNKLIRLPIRLTNQAKINLWFYFMLWIQTNFISFDWLLKFRIEKICGRFSLSFCSDEKNTIQSSQSKLLSPEIHSPLDV